MAIFKPLISHTVSDLNNLPIQEGQFIVLDTDKKIYLDISSSVRIELSNFLTAGDGINISNGAISCSFVPAKYYTGTSTPNNSIGNNGDLYLQTGGV